ncbi:hypothetical protein DSECCO2_617550 [anaerobic digester metagenome]
MVRRVLEESALDRTGPAVLVHRPGLLLCHRDRDVVLGGVFDLPLAGQVLLADRGDHLESGGADDEVEPQLVVALAGAPVRHRGGALLLRNPDALLRYHRAGERGAHRVALVRPVRPDRGEDTLADEPLTGVDRVVFVGDALSLLGRHPDVGLSLTDVHRDCHDAVVVIPFLQERDADRGVEPAREGEHNRSLAHRDHQNSQGNGSRDRVLEFHPVPGSARTGIRRCQRLKRWRRRTRARALIGGQSS